MFKKKLNKAEPKELHQTIEELKRGSAEAFHLLYNLYYQRVYRFCLRMLGDEMSAEDAFQEVFIKVHEHRKEFRGKNFAAWLFTIARHTCLNTLRTRRIHDYLDEENHYSAKFMEEDIGTQDYIKRALMTLPVVMREAVILREYEDCSYQDIAEILGISLSLAKIRVFRAREILRKLLAPIKQELYES